MTEPPRPIEHVALPEFTLWDRVMPRRIPLQFTLEITARCNNACRHCYINLPAGDPAARQQELTLDEVRRLLAEASALGGLWCLLTGGEPLLREDFAEVYLAIKRAGMLISLFTNACLVTPAHVALLQRYPPRELEVTVYGITRETYERVSGCPGSYAAFRRGLDLLLDAGIPVRLKAMALRSNVHELPAMAEFCRAHTADYFRFDPVLHLRYDRDAARNADVRAERLSPAEVATLDQWDPERAGEVNEMCGRMGEPPTEIGELFPLISCGAGRHLFCIGPEGRYRICPALNSPDCVYDWRRGTLQEAWEVFTPKLLARTAANPAQVGGCALCPMHNLCLWCPAHAHLETGDLEGPCGYFCAVAHARAGRPYAGAAE